MVESGTPPHTGPLHDGTRFLIHDSPEGHDLVQVKVLKPERNGRLRRFSP